MTNIGSRLRAALRPAADDDPLVEHARPLTLVAIVRRFAPMLRPLRWWIALSLLLIALAPAIAVVEIFLFQRLVDDVLVPIDWRPLIPLALLYIGLNVLSGALSGADDYVSTYVSQSFLMRLRRDAFDRVVRQPTLAADRRRLGDTMTRLTSDIASVESFMVVQLTEGVSAVVRLGFFLTALFYLQWQLALAALTIVPIVWWLARRFADFTKDVSRERRRRGGSMASVTEEGLSNLALVQTYGREEHAVADYQRQNKAIMEAELTGSRVRAVFLPFVDLAELVGVLTVVGMGVWALETDRLTLGGLLAFLTLLSQCYGPIRDLSDLIPGLFSASAGIERVVELLDADESEPDRRPPLPTPAGAAGAEVELRGVTVRYPGTTGPAFTGLDLAIGAGEHLAVTGPSGSGKSTIARLLSGQVAPAAGEVRLHGHDIAAYSVASVRRTVTPVLQEQLMLDASVWDNIAYARPDADAAEVLAASRLALVEEFVHRLPQGYQTRIGQRGRSLSGGQRQRIAVARALLRPSRVLVLDEPTTGLDPAIGRALVRSVLEATAGRTVIVLTHDADVLTYVDRVVDLREIVAQPPATTHDQEDTDDQDNQDNQDNQDQVVPV